ncbi:MotA/TolQ/ExbB proton channel family protein [Aporhodopirellula aestuarii]|uniref:MotA/TolQ/ExbB proton channel family protein n=1 Tax=Aporhodopirellula aestuarii TaxID=2950107 RepID=A0ABT0U9G8_9BACT|nr:MotA/TolQ/ExbB proton channel family protein [Aporhodopirellula aestuarii]MCM2373457.1 MotA/TolQ/ExbB proton channel family protein [Aporhodopirellula aestuarii]
MRAVVVVLTCLLIVSLGVRSSFAQTGAADVDAAVASVETDSPASDTPELSTQESSAVEELVHKLRQGGIVVVLQILLSIVGVSVALERLVHLRGKALVPPKLVDDADRLWKGGKFDELVEMAGKDGSLLGLVIEEVARHRSAGHQVVSQLAGDVAAREIRRHMQRLFPIALVATLEPLLGLLGTMLGMIGAFETVAVAGSMGDASILADDIAKALVTTAVGLIIAIPAVFIYQCLKSQIGFGSASLDQAASGLISDWLILAPASPDAADETDTKESRAPVGLEVEAV